MSHTFQETIPVSHQLAANVQNPSRISNREMLNSVLSHETTVKVALVAGLVGSLATGLALNADGFRSYDTQKIDTVSPIVNAMGNPADAHLDNAVQVSGQNTPDVRQAKQ